MTTELAIASPASMLWWIEITTVKPCCIYYFGPFLNPLEAKNACFGYIEDLKAESSQVIDVIIKRCQPVGLTICEIDL